MRIQQYRHALLFKISKMAIFTFFDFAKSQKSFLVYLRFFDIFDYGLMGPDDDGPCQVNAARFLAPGWAIGGQWLKLVFFANVGGVWCAIMATSTGQRRNKRKCTLCKL